MNLLLKSKKHFANYFKKPTNRIFKQRRFDMEFEKERDEFKENYKNAIKDIRTQYWKDQDKIESDYIEYFNFYQGNLKWKADSQDRLWIINESFRCASKMKTLIENQQKFLAKQKIWQIEDKEKHEEQQSLLTLLDKQAENWLTPQNFSSKISNVLDLIIPPTIGSHKDYYNKINKYALMIEEGKLEEAEEFKRKDLNQDFKNSLLEPIYSNLKKMIKKLSRTPEHEIYDEYQYIISKLKDKINIKEGKGKEIYDVLTEKYKSLINNIRLANQEPNNKIDLIENTLTCISSLIVAWEKYVEVLYMSNEDLYKVQNKILKEYDNDISDEYPYIGNLSLVDEEAEDIETILGLSNKTIIKNEIMSKLTDVESKWFII